MMMKPATFEPEDQEVVMIVDDNESLRESLGEVLNSAGIRSVGTGTVRDALRLQAVHLPSVTVVDYRLPDGSGIELAGLLKDLAPASPVLMLTGYATMDSAIASVGQLDAYLMKPVAPHTFIQAIINALTRSRLVAENQRLVERLERMTAFQASYDAVTGLPNRTFLEMRLNESVSTSVQSGESLALFFVDLDGLEVLNDLFGHQVGDELLRQMGNRLNDLRRENDTVARFGGNEFVMIRQGADTVDACLFGDRLIETLSRPIEMSGIEHRVRPCIGIVVTDPDMVSQSPESLLQNADTAKYLARQKHQAGWELFELRMRRRVVDRYEIERGLRNAFDGDFSLVYQAVVDLPSANLVGAEALLRWDRVGHGIQLPGAFLPVAEETGLILPIGRWVLDRALSDLAAWRHAGRLPAGFKLWVNVSPHQLATPDFPEVVRELLEVHGIEPEHLGLEILEEALIDAGLAEKALRELRDLGVSLNLDDFGAGHSNLSWLQELPITGIKVDRRFVAGLDVPGNERGPAIVSGLIKLCQALGLEVIGEGVETVEQADALSSMGCYLVQGYYFGRPRPGSPVALSAQSDQLSSPQPS
jgi:diguanylate cyclase (GGDEF)-like protein